MRDELLNETIFDDLDYARAALARWTAAYNQKRPHSAIGYLTPEEWSFWMYKHIDHHLRQFGA